MNCKHKQNKKALLHFIKQLYLYIVGAVIYYNNTTRMYATALSYYLWGDIMYTNTFMLTKSSRDDDEISQNTVQ